MRLRLDEQPSSGNETLTAAVELVVNLANLELRKVDCARKKYTDPTSTLLTRAQTFGANPSGTTFFF